MSKQLIAADEQRGISTPQTLANQPETVKEFQHLLEDRMLSTLDSAAESFADFAELMKVIRDLSRSSAKHSNEDEARIDALLRIASLANIGAIQADSMSNVVGCDYDEARDVHIPALLKALGGEA